jgi:hypothetical protein
MLSLLVFTAVAAGPIDPKEERIPAVTAFLGVQFDPQYLSAANRPRQAGVRPGLPAAVSRFLVRTLGSAMTLPSCFNVAGSFSAPKTQKAAPTTADLRKVLNLLCVIEAAVGVLAAYRAG